MLSMQKNKFVHQVFYKKTGNNFFKQCIEKNFAERRVNNFLNNVEQKIILSRMLEKVYVENKKLF